MSYILDALRRADAERERERGVVPHLHALPALAPQPAAGGARAVAVPLRWLAVVVVAAPLAGLAWWWWQGRPPAETAGAAAVLQAPPPAAVGERVAAAPDGTAADPRLADRPGPTSPAAPRPELASPPPASTLPPQALPAPPPPSPLAPPAPVAPRAMPAPEGAALPPRTVVSEPPPRTVPATPAGAEMPRSPPDAAPPVVALADLPPDLRQAWPALAIGGAVHSDSPGSRFLMVNGQIVREGEAAAPGVTVERIQPRSVLLRWRGRRVELPL